MALDRVSFELYSQRSAKPQNEWRSNSILGNLGEHCTVHTWSPSHAVSGIDASDRGMPAGTTLLTVSPPLEYLRPNDFFRPHPPSFGIVCFEVTTRAEPFQGMNPTQVIRTVVDKRQRPQVPEISSASPAVVPLMEHCWKQKPAERPQGFGCVVQVLADTVARDGDPRNHSAPAVEPNVVSVLNPKRPRNDLSWRKY